MSAPRLRFLFLNVGHAYDHLFMLLFPTVVLVLEREWGMPFAELLPYSLGGFIAFGVGSLPAGWLGDRWSRRHMMTVFFIGIGVASILTGLASGPWTLAGGLTLIGLFGAVYHPVGVAMVVEGVENVGRRLGINGVAGNLGVAAAALTAGALTDFISWRAAFIVPGAISLATGLFFASLHGMEAPRAAGETVGGSPGQSASGLPVVRILVVLGVMTLFGGVIFHATLVAMPKIFSIRLGDIATTTFQVSGLISLIYIVGAFSQILVGWMVDRYPIRWVLVLVAGLQIPFMLAASQAQEWALVLLAAMMTFTIFGGIPIQDTLVARNTADSLRARMYAFKYLISLGVSSLAVPLVSMVYGMTGEFVWLFFVFALFSLTILCSALFLPRAEGAPSFSGRTPVPAQPGTGD